MPLLTLYFQFHQPFRLHPDGATLLWDEKNREIFTQRAEKCYLPTIRMFSDLVHAHYDFKISLGMSGTFLEQAETYKPEVIDVLKGCSTSVRTPGRSSSWSSRTTTPPPPSSPTRARPSSRSRSRSTASGCTTSSASNPAAFPNTALSYSNEVANIVADMGFKAILCEPSDKTVSVRTTAHRAYQVYRAIGRKGRPRKLAVLPAKCQRMASSAAPASSGFDAGCLRIRPPGSTPT